MHIPLVANASNSFLYLLVFGGITSLFSPVNILIVSSYYNPVVHFNPPESCRRCIYDA